MRVLLQVNQAVTTAGANAFAEYVVASAESCYPVKEATGEAVAVSLSGLTAAGALEVQCSLFLAMFAAACALLPLHRDSCPRGNTLLKL